MIINYKEKWVYIDPPRTGSTSLGIYFADLGGTGDLVGMQSPLRHIPPNPMEIAGYKVIISVRHPVTRAWSLYHHRSKYIEGLDPIEFASSLVDGTAWYWDRWTCSDYFRQYKGASVIRMEHMEEDLQALGFYQPPPHLNSLATGEIPSEFAFLATKWGYEDIERWY